MRYPLALSRKQNHLGHRRSRILGSAITAELDTQCAKVVCLDLLGRAEAFVSESGLQRTIPQTLDLTDVEKIPAAVDAVIAAHGLPDGLVYLPTASSRGHTSGKPCPLRILRAPSPEASLPPSFSPVLSPSV